MEENKKLMERYWDKLTSEDLWESVINASLEILLILLASWIAVRLGKKFIKKVFLIRMRSPLNHSERRQRTIARLLQSVISYVVYFSAIIGILSSLEIKVAGLLAGAGIVGLAIGFGAQSLVKDVITGFFIIFEDQFGVGDYIKINAAEGTVVEIGLRTTKINGATGEQFIIPNGAIGEVVNYSVNNSKIFIDLQMATEADFEKAEAIINKYLETLPKMHKELIATPVFLGVQNVKGTEVTIRIAAETLPQQQYGVARSIRRDVTKLFEENNIPMAYPKMMFYGKEEGRSE
ncbi:MULTISPECIES: mechanosensitive ion channel family protein [Lysinibacillus]|jgi:small-conductance mechanosensitive channel|uniref:mechanosensitive ion channel family protein n=1 Tax=Lysinibacillus TaxID=400634 RepID=UPI0005620EB4|nr:MULTISPECIES: mechanosensitive ion channel family protein [Lysinibacillus]KUF34311.1 mechanosensitive ion channel protein MscS [Lysinibacillus sp. F5]WCH47834.1 mechanosensitive ion channel family protein [Lysinibacillus sp. OF-1]SCY67486.1 small conductance mechanosensitive channel [Lysinibacillus sp. SG9]SDB32270.1 small conductance mechanosensitive channel [Lysinibacillus sp. TC-37]SFS92069.1 small conductance mechanosensitive channel [Lysinibacillus sp. SG55]